MSGTAADRWQNHWTPLEREELQRVQRRFRHHVRTRWNPRGRIHREPCCLCSQPVGNPSNRVEAHHLDYAQPFKVVWLCVCCHRRVEHGLSFHPRLIWDYTSLVVTRKGAWKQGAVERGEQLEEAPF